MLNVCKSYSEWYMIYASQFFKKSLFCYLQFSTMLWTVLKTRNRTVFQHVMKGLKTDKSGGLMEGRNGHHQLLSMLPDETENSWSGRNGNVEGIAINAWNWRISFGCRKGDNYKKMISDLMSIFRLNFITQNVH